MGASGWAYFVPYKADLHAALEKLKQDVFQRGDYLLLEDWSLMNEEYEQVRAGVDREIARAERLKKRAALPKPASIEELFEWNMESGTHSIIDMMNGISDEVAFGTVSPLTNDQLLETFGTTTPTHEQIEQRTAADDWEYNFRRRWESLYVIVYNNGAPSELYFAGTSGD